MSTFSFRTVALFLAGSLVVTGCLKRDKPAERDKQEDRAATENAWLEEQRALVEQHQALVKENKPISDEQRARFADAYYKVGVSVFRGGDWAKSEAYFREALRLRPEHARAIMRLGDLCAARSEFKAAAQAYERAAKLDATLAQTVRERRLRLLDRVLVIADQRLRDYEIAGAKQVLEFVEQYLNDVGGDQARRRLAELAPLLEAERLLAEAKRDVASGKKADGFRKLRQVATAYPRSYFEQEANRLLEENGQKFIVHDTATGFKIPPDWGRVVTEHFEIYYEKRRWLPATKRAAEEAFDKITTTFGMSDAEWRTRITAYIFEDEGAWDAFVAANEDKHIQEWAYAFAAPWGNEIYLHIQSDKGQMFDHTLPHELAHVVHYRYVGGIYQPIFLMEGIAVSMEDDGVRNARREIKRRVGNHTAFPLVKLFGLTDYPKRDVRLFYMESATVVGFLIDEYGLERFKEFMFAFRNTSSTAQAIEHVYGISLDTFEKKWEKYVR
jgi:tetratricopeptide (TPR) repeat protein